MFRNVFQWKLKVKLCNQFPILRNDSLIRHQFSTSGEFIIQHVQLSANYKGLEIKKSIINTKKKDY